ncbi:MAG: hypothetical protein MHM6MM_009496 [Cercozoa sp. M6MM]
MRQRVESFKRSRREKIEEITRAFLERHEEFERYAVVWDARARWFAHEQCIGHQARIGDVDVIAKRALADDPADADPADVDPADTDPDTDPDTDRSPGGSNEIHSAVTFLTRLLLEI